MASGEGCAGLAARGTWALCAATCALLLCGGASCQVVFGLDEYGGGGPGGGTVSSTGTGGAGGATTTTTTTTTGGGAGGCGGQASPLPVFVQDDTYIDSDNQSSNFGGDPTLIVSLTARALLRFNIDPESLPDCTIQKAVVTMYPAAAQPTPGDFKLYSIQSANADWGESGATWMLKGAGGLWSGGDGMGDLATNGDLMQWGSVVTPLEQNIGIELTFMQPMKNDIENANKGLVLATETGSVYSFQSGESAMPAKLEVFY